GRARRSVRSRGDRRRHLRRADRRASATRAAPQGAVPRAAVLVGGVGAARARDLPRGRAGAGVRAAANRDRRATGPGRRGGRAGPRRASVRLALAHDWLTGMRGGEKALEVVCERFPDAELFTLVHVPGSVSPTIERRPIHTSFVQRLPAVRRYYR